MFCSILISELLGLKLSYSFLVGEELKNILHFSGFEY